MLHRSPVRWIATVSGFALKDVVREAAPSDVLIASWNGSVFKYSTFPGVGREEVCNHLLRLPLFDRGIHTVFGRDDVPVDFAADIDCKVPSVTRDGKPTARPNRDEFLTEVVNAVLTSLDKELAAINCSAESRYVLQSNYPARISAHVHVRLADEKAFHDHVHMGAFARRVAKGVVAPDGAPAYRQAFLDCVDTAIYRRAGTLRLFNAVNRQQQSPLHLVPRTTTTKGREHWVVGPQEPAALLDASLVVRDPLDVDEVVTIEGAADAAAAAAGGASQSVRSISGGSGLPDDPLRLLDIACEALVRLPPRMAESYRPWSTVYLTAKSTAVRLAACGVPADVADERLRQSFHDFSRLCPEKYNPREVDKKWNARQREGFFDASVNPKAGVSYLVQRTTSPVPSLNAPRH